MEEKNTPSNKFFCKEGIATLLPNNRTGRSWKDRSAYAEPKHVDAS